ncbi:MAG: hypothetical protein JSS61_06630 [Verrucomicrobia bacterium]|nr:hypothetical protein [Verrucomicrobiota bacterium]
MEVAPVHTLGHMPDYFRSTAMKSCCYSLLSRISTDWRTLIMDASVITSLFFATVTFVAGATVIASAFLIAAVTGAIGSWYARRMAAFADLEVTAKDLKTTRASLEEENKKLSASNEELSANNAQFQTNVQTLEATNSALNGEVLRLNVQVNNLSASAVRVREEVNKFQGQNATLGQNVTGLDACLRTLDAELRAARALTEQINAQFSAQEENLTARIDELANYLRALGNPNAVTERIQNLSALQTQLGDRQRELGEVREAFAAEAARLQEVRNSLQTLKSQFESSIREAANSYQVNNAEHARQLDQLRHQCALIQTMLQSHTGTGRAPRPGPWLGQHSGPGMVSV